MRFFVIPILVLFHFSTLSQINSAEFIITKYSFGKKSEQELVEIVFEKESQIDMKFYEESFSLPKVFPDNLINPEYKNDTIVVWEFEDREKNTESNWSYTHIYDSLSRIITYSYSGCSFCSNSPYRYKVEYNSKGLIINIKNQINFQEEYEMKYNAKEDLVKMKYFFFNELQQKIKLKK